VRLGTTPPSNGNYNGPTHSLGYTYPVNSGIPTGAWQPVGLFCTTGPANCDGHALNHMYTRADLRTAVWPLDGNDWRSGGVVADLVPPTGAGSCPSGLKPVYRTWIFSGSRNQNHTYFALLDPDLSPFNGQPGGGHELVGCVWPSAS
jgi:hypothetical protein